MKKVKFNFELISKGRLVNVFFRPEKERNSILIETDNKRKKWKAEKFELMIENPFDYELVVFGVSGTKWEASLKIVEEDDEKEFLSWKGETGDTRRNISERTKPQKNV